jgi:hypothetical protein
MLFKLDSLSVRLLLKINVHKIYIMIETTNILALNNLKHTHIKKVVLKQISHIKRIWEV